MSCGHTNYIIDPTGLGNVAAEYDGTGTLIARYDHGFGLLARADASNTAYYTFDALGSTRELTDDATGAVLNSPLDHPDGIAYSLSVLQAEGLPQSVLL